MAFLHLTQDDSVSTPILVTMDLVLKIEEYSSDRTVLTTTVLDPKNKLVTITVQQSKEAIAKAISALRV